MIDPITFGAGVSESGVAGVSFPELGVGVWYKGIAAPVAASRELAREPGIARTLAEEGGRTTVAAAAPSGLQARIVFEGVWDVILLDSFEAVTVPIPDCSLVLQLFEEDGVTVAWEVGTSPYHTFPYLCLPENYGAQEIDIIAGAATIGQVEVIVVDKAQTPGDQDSGWLTERLTVGGVAVIRGRRCRLVRYISAELGYVVIADGTADTPRMDDSYAAYRWVIRDVRDTERAIRAFTRSNAWILPMGLAEGWGRYLDEEGDPQWLVSPQAPLVGTYKLSTGLGMVVLDDYWQDAFDANDFPTTPVVLSDDVEIADGVIPLQVAGGELLGSPGKTSYVWPDLEVLWRVAGSGDGWTVVSPAHVSQALRSIFVPFGLIYYRNQSLGGGGGAEFVDGTQITAAFKVVMRGQAEDGSLQDGDFPSLGQSIEFALRYLGVPTEATPLHIEMEDDGVTPLTAGRLLQKLYDGEYSDRDLETGDVVSTDVRYDASALLQMTDPVRLRITEPVDDMRDWAERHVYAPTGWAPALDNNLAISPASQVIPNDFTGLPALTDANTEPVPAWNAGETLINVLEFAYARWYSVPEGDGAATTTDRLQKRDISIVYRSASSITRKEQQAKYETDAFAAVGDSNGIALESERAALLAEDRCLYIFERYNTGAQTIEIPVRRADDTALLRAGSWVIVDLSWLPDYVTRRRGAAWGGQIVAIHDIDCAWRIFLIEEAVPLVTS